MKYRNPGPGPGPGSGSAGRRPVNVGCPRRESRRGHRMVETSAWLLAGRSGAADYATTIGSRVSICALTGVRRACQKPNPTSIAVSAAMMNDAIAPHSMTMPISENA
jgi:hypothetical protein